MALDYEIIAFNQIRAFQAEFKLNFIHLDIQLSQGTALAETTVGIAAKSLVRRIEAMIMTNKLLPVALVAALIGGSVGALVMHSRNPSTAQTQASLADNPRNVDAQYAGYQQNQVGTEQYVPAQYTTASEQGAYKTGFADGIRACESGVAGSRMTASNLSSQQYRNTGRSYARSSSSTRRVYYDYQRPKGRSFWQKHRDKLTVAMGTGGGALIGGLIGGKKGAAIGALGGAGGSALYTYKLRNRNRRY